MEEINYRQLQDDLRRAWEELEYAHLWLTASDWDDDTNIDDKLSTARVKARAYQELVDRLSWMMRRS
ncbi:MAG: hypothetical protein WCD37_09540 [Chloroflexia bacterium]